MSSSAPLPPRHNYDSFSLPVSSPITDHSPRPGPATRLLNDLFDEMDQLNTPDPINSSYIMIAESSDAHSRPRSRVKFSRFMLDLPNTPGEPPTSPTSMTSDQQDGYPFKHSRPHVNSEEGLLEPTSKFKEIQTRNIINGNPRFTSNSLPNHKFRSSLHSTSSTDSQEEYQTMIQKLRETFESSRFLTGAQMRAMAPRVFYTPALKKDIKGKGKGKVNSEVDEMEKNAIEILEALFGELNEREAGSSEEEWKTADELIDGIFNKHNNEDDDYDEKVENKDKGKGKEKEKEVEVEHIEDIKHSMEYEASETSEESYQAADTNKPQFPEINMNLSDEEHSDDDEEQLAEIQRNINMSLRHMKFDHIVEDNGGQQEHIPSSSSGESEETSFTQYLKAEETSTHSQHDIQGSSPITQLDTIVEHEEKIDEQNDSGSEESFNTAPSIKLHLRDTGSNDTCTNENDTKSEDEHSDTNTEEHTPPESVNSGSDTSSSTDCSIDDGAQDNDSQAEMAALATGVLAASLWMIERRIAASS
ncbi:hypothetical protein EYC80_008217 [Monilinia laxa]|uniref:Uncharacterized protein n=1 Tax=Monilinia laxa TaxID=61186 RepID=A0A5N6JV20_MONLA|nr:hypothetical protein EYC80_008217 [Monilinia laxa]